MPKEPNEILNVAEAASLLHLHQKSIYKLARKGEIPAKRVGRSWRFSRSVLIEFVKNALKEDR